MINIIVAIARHSAIGRCGDLLFHISEDLRRFKRITMGHPIVMGRNTFESFPKGPLPGRLNVVASRNEQYCPEGATVVPSLAAAIDTALAADQEIFIIGGGQIYASAIAVADRLLVTEIDAEVADADTFFPAIDPNLWEIDEQTPWSHDERSGVNYRFICFIKK
jgi:dihydrofolate reductase